MRLWKRMPQLLRRTLQLGVLAFIAYAALGGIYRNYKLAHNNERLVRLMKGDTWAFLYGLNEDALSLLGEPDEASLEFLGFPWAGRFFGLDTADPLLVASHVVHTGELRSELWLALLIPLGLALLLGKVFCSHLCPMRLVFELGSAVRAGLLRLDVPLPELSKGPRVGGWVLLGGLGASFFAGTTVWLFLLPYVSLSASAFLWITTGAVSVLAAVVAAWFVFEVVAAPGFFCHKLCPTGFLLETVGRLSLLRLVKRGEEPCPTGCDLCERTCPYALSPKNRTHRPACDNCGRCVVACPSDRLVRRLAIVPVLALAVLAIPNPASAHHNKGLPHYGYYENYPQVPTEEYVAIQGNWEIGATLFNFQGYDRRQSDTPNDVKIFMYLYDLEAGAGYRGPLDVEIRDEDGELVSRFERVTVDEEAVYSTRETMPESGDYELVAIIGGEVVGALPFHVDLLDEGVDPWVLFGIGAPVLLVFGLAWFGRNRRRRRRRSVTTAATTAVLLSAIGLSYTPPVFAQSEGSAEMPSCYVPVDPAMAALPHYATPDGGTVMVMGGLPPWLFLAGVAAVILLSFLAVERWGRMLGAGFRRDLLGRGWLFRLVRSRWFQVVPQLVMVGLLAFLIYVGLFGSPLANLTPVAVWTIWWAGLVFAVLLLASVWCFVCPWDGLANLMSRLRIAARVEPLSLGLRFPDWLKNVYPAIALFVLLTWLELGWGVTTDAKSTAYMGLGMAGAAVIGALLWDGKRFCAHMCPVGRICGIYSTLSPVEVRARKARTCEACTTEDCLHGNERGYACPTGLSLKVIQSSAMCTMCTECFKSCDKQNVTLNLRPFGADLRQVRAPRLDEAWLALSLLALTLFHGLSMTSVWESFAPGEASLLKWMSLSLGTAHVTNFTLAMIVACAMPIGLYWLSCRVAVWWAGGGVTVRQLFVRYAYGLLPIALFYHLAHNLMHLLMEGGEIVPLASDPLGTGADYLGTAGVHVGSLISEEALWYGQVALILIGHVVGVLVAYGLSRGLYEDEKAARRSLVPITVVMILISVAGLGLMHLDMNMRMGRM